MKKRIFMSIVAFYIGLIGMSFVRPLLIKRLMDDGLVDRDMRAVLFLSLVLFVVSLIEATIRIVQAHLFLNIQNKLILNVYTKAFGKLMHVRNNYFEKHNSSETISKLATDIEVIVCWKRLSLKILNLI